MNTKVNEGKLISGKEALTRVTEGIVQYKCDDESVADRWTTITDHFWDQYNLGVFLNENTTWKFRLKPRTILINGIEVPAPFEPKEGENIFIPANFLAQGYMECKYPTFENHVFQFGACAPKKKSNKSFLHCVLF